MSDKQLPTATRDAAAKLPAPVAVSTEIARMQKEIEAACIMAERRPRNEEKNRAAILKSCTRPAFADEAIYAVERGKDKKTGEPNIVTGESIALLRAIKTMWGNVRAGVRTLSRDAQRSVIEGWAWDVETGSYAAYETAVEHKRYTKGGSYLLDNPDQIEELCGARGSRLERKALKETLPPDLVAEAFEACQNTLKGAVSKDVDGQVEKMFAAFEKEFNIDPQSILDHLEKAKSEIDVDDVLRLRGVFRALKDEQAPEEFGLKVKTTGKPEAKREEQKTESKPTARRERTKSASDVEAKTEVVEAEAVSEAAPDEPADDEAASEEQPVDDVLPDINFGD